MITKTLISLALVAGCAIALAVPATQAQTIDTQVLTAPPRLNAGDRADWLASRNNAASAQYDVLLETSPEFRQSRILKECGPITDLQLRASCLESFNAAEDQPPLGWHDRMTGDNTGTMNSTGATPYSLDMYGAGAGR
jgi:hypothetical protein